MEILVVDPPSQSDRDAIVRPLVAFNEATVGPSGFRQIAILLRDAGETQGGLWAKASFGWLYVELLVVPEEARGQGLGAKLMARAEDEARKLGCRGLWVDCFTPMRGFYEKLGYEAFGAIPDHPEGVERVFLRKTLS
ncbi:GNAT family N-acetyltransferase [Hansschlegelia quercus]|uniref:GNAT family N-acetyltransferase n=1 Tax=Hansschlegelia quercus TaxID=2528245 RepID=A0A4Q9GBT4_9HYPH|nr:GNAT family N-acetyltransferase [Hansschlegelia quercus]TBN48636.1 GNAT family N-acetyltransferase [Hansschlegelia quercus]